MNEEFSMPEIDYRDNMMSDDESQDESFMSQETNCTNQFETPDRRRNNIDQQEEQEEWIRNRALEV